MERRSGKFYVVNPYKMLIDNGFFYLLTYNGTKNIVYRIDRMKDVKELLTAREWEKEFEENVDMDNYTKRVFSMFGGKRERVTIRFIDQRLDTVVDQFGIAGVKYEKVDDTHFTAQAEVEISDMFYSWVCGFGRRAKIIDPPHVVEGMREFVKKVSDMYEPKLSNDGSNHASVVYLSKVIKSYRFRTVYSVLHRFTHFYVVLFQTADNVDFVHVLLQVRGQDVQVVFGDIEAALTEYLLERNHRAAHGDPFLCEGVTEAMDSCSFDTADVAIVPQGMIATASGELVAVGGDEEPIFEAALSVLQVLMENLHDVLIQGDNEWFSVLRDVYIDNAVVEVQILDFDVYKAVLADAS